MKAAIITVGDEILLGQIVDTNSAHIATELADIGVRVEEIRSVSDSKVAIGEAVSEMLRLYDVVIMTGGLGPTKDDITKRTLAELFGVEMVRDEASFQHIKEFLEPRGVVFNELNQAQADIPEGFEALLNKLGTAPGLFYNSGGHLLFCLAGVPFEMKALLAESVIPRIGELFSLGKVVRHTVMVFGIPESELALKISEWEDALPEYLKLAYLPNPAGIRLRLTATGGGSMDEIRVQFELLKGIIPEYYLGDYPTSIEEQVARLLVERGESLAVAESCTGGKIASKCTMLSGASEWFVGSVTSYCNSVKQGVLGVSSQSLDEHGAVSHEVVRQMACGVRERLGSTYGLATSGIAGPGGATAEKSLGDIFIALSTERGVRSWHRNFGQPRTVFIERASSAALNYLREELLK